METHRAKGTADQGAWQPSPTRDICARAEPILSAHHSCASSAAAAPDSQPAVRGFQLGDIPSHGSFGWQK